MPGCRRWGADDRIDGVGTQDVVEGKGRADRVGGTWLTPPALVAAGDWHAITALARDAAPLAS